MIYLYAFLWLLAGIIGVYLIICDWVSDFGYIRGTQRLLIMWCIGVIFAPVSFGAGILVWLVGWLHRNPTKTLFIIGEYKA